MKRLTLLLVSMMVVVISATATCQDGFVDSIVDSFDEAEFHIGLQPTIALSRCYLRYEFMSVGLRSPNGLPLLTFETSFPFSLVVPILRSVFVTSIKIADFEDMNAALGISLSLGWNTYHHIYGWLDSDWVGEIGLVLSTWLEDTCFNVRIATGTPEYISIGVGFTWGIFQP